MGASGGPKIVRDSLKLLLDGRDEGLRGGKSALTDGSGNSNSGSMYTGACLNFDGSNDYVGSSASLPSQVGSLSFWAYITGHGDLISSGTSDNDFRVLTNNVTGFYISGEYRVSYTYPTSTWIHGCVTWGSAGTKIYVNGSQVATNEAAPAAFDQTGITIGNIYSAYNNGFAGKLSDIKVYNTTLSAADASELYNNPNKVIPNGISTSSLVGWWPMSEGTGTRAYDGSGNNHYGTLTNGPTHETAHRYIPQLAGKGLSQKAVFDGSNDYVDMGASGVVPAGGNNYTVSTWFNIPDTSTGYREIIAQWTSANSGNSFFLGTNATDNIRFSDDWNNVDIGTWSINEWHHLVAISTTNNAYIYFDGVLKATKGSALGYTGVGNLVIGRQGTLDGEYWKGLIDEVAIWNVALDADAISAIYNSGQPLDVRDNYLLYDEYTDNLSGYWRNQGAAKWIDLSTNSNNGTTNGSPAVINSPEGKTSGRDSHGMNLSSPNGGLVSGTSYISVADSDDFYYGTDNFTIEMWAKRPTGAGSGTIYHQYVNDTNFQQIFYHSNNLLYLYNRVSGTATPYFNTGSALPLDTWHHLVFVRYGTGANNMYVYVDTVSQSITWNTGLSANANIPNLATDLWFGKTDPYGYGTWGGQLSSMKVYKGKALSTAEISQNYNMHKSRFK